jgi:hypothetical protein
VRAIFLRLMPEWLDRRDWLTVWKTSARTFEETWCDPGALSAWSAA